MGELVRRPEVGSLEHYGVKGMKWGQHNKSSGDSGGSGGGGGVGKVIKNYRHAPDSSGVSRSQARREIKKLNRETSRNLQDFQSSANRSNLIRAARNNQVAAHRKYQDIKSDLKDQKSTGAIGKNAARIALARARNERYQNSFKSSQKTAGEQFMEALFAPRVVVTRR